MDHNRVREVLLMKYKIIISGDTGHRVMFTGKILIKAAELSGYHTLWFPLQISQMRGETATCALMLSKDPLTDDSSEYADILIAMDRLSLRRFGNKAHGLIITDERFADENAKMRTVAVNTVTCNPGSEYEGLNNMIMLGAFLSESDITNNAVMEALEAYTDTKVAAHAFRAMETGRQFAFSHRHSSEENMLVSNS